MKKAKRFLVATMCTSVFFLGGCGPIFKDLALSAAWEFIWDNDATFDFFGDDGPGLLQ